MFKLFFWIELLATKQIDQNHINILYILIDINKHKILFTMHLLMGFQLVLYQGRTNMTPYQICSFYFFLLFIYLFLIFIYLFLVIYGLCWVFISVRGLSLVAASGGHSSSRCAGLSLSRPLLLRSTGSRRAGLVIVAHGPSCSAACGIFPDQGSNPCALHWQADSQPLRHQGSPLLF